MSEPLALLQARFVDSITRVPVAAGFEPEPPGAYLRADTEAEASFRLGIYRSLHESRLHDFLAEEFPRVVALLGAERFHGIVRGYLQVHPSRSSTLSDLGADFADFVEDHPLTRERADAADVARLDRARNEMFDAADDVPVTPADMPRLFASAVAPRFRLTRASSLVGTTWDVDRAWTAADQGHEAPAPDVGPSMFLVWRRDHTVRHRKLGRAEYPVLRALEYGLGLGELCALVAGARAPEAAAPHVFETLSQWTVDGLLVLES